MSGEAPRSTKESFQDVLPADHRFSKALDGESPGAREGGGGGDEAVVNKVGTSSGGGEAGLARPYVRFGAGRDVSGRGARGLNGSDWEDGAGVREEVDMMREKSGESRPGTLTRRLAPNLAVYRYQHPEKGRGSIERASSKRCQASIE